MDIRPRRSALYLPASNARAMEKARTLPADVLILDLEDAVAPDSKDEARARAAEAAGAGGFGGREVVIRVNGLDTPWGESDLRAAAEAAPDAILAPKVSTADELRAYDSRIGGRARLWIMVETCASFFNLAALAAAARTTRLHAWVVGANDLAKEMRCQPGVDRAPLAPFLAAAVMAARSQGLTILDGVFNDIDDEAGFERECRQGVAFGFDGKTLIHPRQIAAANAAFAPDAAEIAWSRRVIEAFSRPESAEKGALRVDGRMVERLHLAQAQRTLAVAEALAARS